MTNNIKQHSPEWYEAKQSLIGGSQIYSLAHYYCKKELEQIGVDTIKEVPFKTALEIYLEHKFNIKPEPIPQVNSEFGLGIESYIISRINQENQNLVSTGSKDFIVNKDLHPLACCSPDGKVGLSGSSLLDVEISAGDDTAKYSVVDCSVRDYDDKVTINVNDGLGMLEVKTTQFTFNYEAKAGAKWQYLFQINYNALICGNHWALLACLTPKEKEFDTDFFKGKILGCLQTIAGITAKPCLESIDKYYNLYTYIYKANKTIQNICELALKRFQEALDKDDMPLASIWNEEKLMREKKMLAQMFPEKFGKIQADKELNDLLNERGILNNESKKIKTEFEAVNCEIIKRMKHNIEAEGFHYKAKFDKKGSLRVSQNKNSDVTDSMVEELLAKVDDVNIDYMAGG